MILHQTKLLREAAEEPTSLDIERILHQRNYSRTSEPNYKLRNLEAGEAGEQIVYNYLEDNGRKDWIGIRNMWLNYGGPFEGDLILLTNHKNYLFEVKNYNSTFTYEKGISKFNDRKNSGNPVHQTRRNTINLQNMCHEFSREITVQGVLVLVGIDNYVEINSEIKDVDVVKRNELKHYIQKMVEKDNAYEGWIVNKKSLIEHFERYEIEPYYGPEMISKEQMNSLRKGIYCLHCKKFHPQINRKTVSCSCGFIEEREMAILRTICEYGVLTFNKPLKTGKLWEFFGRQVSRKSIRKVLQKYFQFVANGRYSHFINIQLPLYKLYDKLKVDSSVQVMLTHQEYENFSCYMR